MSTTQKRVGGHRVGNYGAWDARAFVQDAAHLPPALYAWLAADPDRVNEFRWKDGVKPVLPWAAIDGFHESKKPQA